MRVTTPLDALTLTLEPIIMCVHQFIVSIFGALSLSLSRTSVPLTSKYTSEGGSFESLLIFPPTNVLLSETYSRLLHAAMQSTIWMISPTISVSDRMIVLKSDGHNT